MPAPREEPCTKISLNLPDRLLDQIAQYPGQQTWKIEMLLDYALKMGALMTPQEAQEIAYNRALEMIKQTGITDNRKKKRD